MTPVRVQFERNFSSFFSPAFVVIVRLTWKWNNNKNTHTKNQEWTKQNAWATASAAKKHTKESKLALKTIFFVKIVGSFYLTYIHVVIRFISMHMFCALLLPVKMCWCTSMTCCVLLRSGFLFLLFGVSLCECVAQTIQVLAIKNELFTCVLPEMSENAPFLQVQPNRKTQEEKTAYNAHSSHWNVQFRWK